tara:strand:+ start:362 stop:1417 length:1056 start_codon:yes stop_codon:yes gene_type:complete
MTISIKLGKRKISDFTKPYLIAEIGVNHGGSVKLAKKMILLAKKSGMDAAKFQTYKAEKLVIKNSPSYWDLNKEKTNSQYKLFKKYDVFEKKDYVHLKKFCKKIKIDFLTTPFDVESLKWIKNLVPAFKIASADINNVPLLKEIGYLKKPVLLSTGASSIKEIKFAVNLLKKCGSKNIVIMHCILNYPTKYIDANLSMINDLKRNFPKNLIGYSDHTSPSKIISPCAIAFQLGARVIEKHFTFNKKKNGNDHYHSADFNDAFIMKKQIDKIYLLNGHNKKKVINCEKKSRLFARRSIVSNSDIKKNEIFNEKNLITKRPGTGISPLLWNKIIGKRSKRNIKADTQIQTKDF